MKQKKDGVFFNPTGGWYHIYLDGEYLGKGSTLDISWRIYYVKKGTPEKIDHMLSRRQLAARVKGY